LPRVLAKPETKRALQSLYRYNFAPDVGQYRSQSKIQGGRWYALPTEPGLLMCTWPQGGAEKAAGTGNEAWAVGYFNECMTGFEHQVAGHMIWEGLVEQGLTIEKAIHDRYDAKKRNPYNEIECSDHYARAMASFGVYLAACGYQHHGPNQALAFAPKIQPENFKCAFTAAGAWGTYKQKIGAETMSVSLTVKCGKLGIKQLGVQLPKDWPAGLAFWGTKRLSSQSDSEITWIDMAEIAEIPAGKTINLKVQKSQSHQ